MIPSPSARRLGFSALLLFLAALPARADDALTRMDAFLAPGNSGGIAATLEPGTDGAPRVLSEGARGSAVVARSSSDTWSVNGRAERMTLGRSPMIPASGLRFPDRLWDLQAGGAFRRRLAGRRGWGVSAGVGSASDEPFHSLHETEVQATGHVTVPSGERNAWVFLLTYSNNRTFANNIPLPGFAYLFHDPDHGLHMALGFPFVSLSYAPAADWTFRGSFFGPTSRSVELARRLPGGLRAYGALEHGARGWFRANRDVAGERIFYEESKAVAGVRTALPAGLSVDLSGGRSFDRRFFEAKNVQTAGVSKARAGDAWIFSLDLSGRWGG